jgi:hypothetical protein
LQTRPCTIATSSLPLGLVLPALRPARQPWCRCQEITRAGSSIGRAGALDGPGQACSSCVQRRSKCRRPSCRSQVAQRTRLCRGRVGPCLDLGLEASESRLLLGNLVDRFSAVRHGVIGHSVSSDFWSIDSPGRRPRNPGSWCPARRSGSAAGGVGILRPGCESSFRCFALASSPRGMGTSTAQV